MPGVYISYPFCAQKCSFCNFASGAFSRELEAQYSDALHREIQAHAWQWTPDTLYLGGGTPSNLDPAALARLLEAVPGQAWKEATVEAAPGTITAEKAEAWRRLGINRVSLGVQSFVAKELAQTGRKHTAATVAADCHLLREHGITNWNLDLIAGLPHQTPESWQESLDWIARLDPPHVSVYLFEVDEDSRLGFEILNNGRRYGANALPSDDLAADLYQHAVERLDSMGIHRYEISNFSKPGLESIHNRKYWTMAPYAGFGVDAHSFDGQQRTGNIDSVSGYIEAVMSGKSPASSVTPSNGAEERLFTGLRLSEGIQLDESEWTLHRTSIERFLDAGLLEMRGSRIRLTSRGVLLSNEVFQEFLAA